MKNKKLHQQLSQIDNEAFSAFCNSFGSINWNADFKDDEDEYCGIDLQLTAQTLNRKNTYDIELKCRFQNKLYSDCFFEWEKWYRLVYWDNETKLYVAIYPYCNKIAIWNVNTDLLKKSERALIKMNYSFCGSHEKVEKQVLKFKLSDAKLFDYDLTPFKEKYNAIYKQIQEKEQARLQAQMAQLK